ncbi:V-ATPase V1 sector subunit E [Lobulomyces angularis]|nr:V-ATPase V1 sector subunit E [Lobulomyces angularis]
MSGLNDQEVANEMNKMVAFIKQEALEKAREIKVKADEEFNIEKAKLVRQETLNIEAFYQKKTKLAEVQRKIAQSNHVNKSRLKVLQARQQMLNELFLEARKRLPIITDNRESYSKLLSGLILQGLYQLMESKVTIQCRKKDLEFVKAACEDSKAAYLKNFPKLSVNFEFDEENPLPENCPGGAVVSVMQGKICCANTLDARLDLLADKMLPDIRILLFGVSENRAFYN